MNDVFCIPTTFLEAMNQQAKDQKLIAAEIRLATLEAENARLLVENERLSALVARCVEAAAQRSA